MSTQTIALDGRSARARLDPASLQRRNQLIRDIRERELLSMADIAERVGVSIATVHRVLKAGK